MTENLITRRLMQIGGLLLLVDGISGIVMPRRRSLVWHLGPELAKAATEELADHPRAARAVNAAKTALGVVLLTR
ncbi:MAG TPA: hypothetical protein VK993_10370 [Chthoniobacterales bacterium]|nr:hypothetical protein [Chthoniobacterales bacterium]